MPKSNFSNKHFVFKTFQILLISTCFLLLTSCGSTKSITNSAPSTPNSQTKSSLLADAIGFKNLELGGDITVYSNLLYDSAGNKTLMDKVINEQYGYSDPTISGGHINLILSAPLYASNGFCNDENSTETIPSLDIDLSDYKTNELTEVSRRIYSPDSTKYVDMIKTCKSQEVSTQTEIHDAKSGKVLISDSDINLKAKNITGVYWADINSLLIKSDTLTLVSVDKNQLQMAEKVSNKIYTNKYDNVVDALETNGTTYLLVARDNSEVVTNPQEYKTPIDVVNAETGKIIWTLKDIKDSHFHNASFGVNVHTIYGQMFTTNLIDPFLPGKVEGFAYDQQSKNLVTSENSILFSNKHS